MLHTGHGGSVDFAFIDADKGNYVNYYKICLQLVRQGGIVRFDNTLFKVRAAFLVLVLSVFSGESCGQQFYGENSQVNSRS